MRINTNSHLSSIVSTGWQPRQSFPVESKISPKTGQYSKIAPIPVTRAMIKMMAMQKSTSSPFPGTSSRLSNASVMASFHDRPSCLQGSGSFKLIIFCTHIWRRRGRGEITAETHAESTNSSSPPERDQASALGWAVRIVSMSIAE